jgi:hypothetical protein
MRALSMVAVTCSQDQPSDALRQTDLINRSAWRERSSARSFRHRKAWTGAGESGAFDSVGSNAAHRPILDLGVSAGRSAPRLHGTGHDSVRLAYVPELVQARLQKDPDVRIIEGDARDLFPFADGAFPLGVRK